MLGGVGMEVSMFVSVCRDCGKSYKGSRVCHCAECHETFGGVSGFDSHISKGECVDPAEMESLHMGVGGMWVQDCRIRGHVE